MSDKENMARYFLFLSIFFLSSCNEVHIDVSKKIANPLPDSNPVNTLVWNFPSPTLRAGESIPFSFTNGGVSFTTDSNGVGNFDPSTLIYTVPINQAPASHSLSIEDDSGKSGTNSVKIAGFQFSNEFKFPLTFGDSNQVRSSAVLDNGSIFTASVVSDSTNWKRWSINRSNDEGLTWEQVDYYSFAEHGESHPMSMVNKGNDLYVCGHAWDSYSDFGNEQWIVRKSSDNGATWTTVDQYEEHEGEDHVCRGMAVSAFGTLYAVGSNDTDGGVIRESVDDGATWTTIGKIAGAHFLVTVEVSPAGVVWTVDYYGRLHKGTHTLGVWNWIDAGPVMGTLGVVSYDLFGDLEIVSENEAYFSGNSVNWRIRKTIDGGSNWNQVYTGAVRFRGHEIKKLSTGELVAIGMVEKSNFLNPDTFKIIRSVDDGLNWNETYSNSSPSSEGITLVETSNSLMAFGSFDGKPLQIVNLRSTDAGATWSNRSVIYHRENLFTYIADFKVDRLGNLWATGDLELIDDTYLTPWSVIKSTDNGSSWIDSDLFTGTTSDGVAGAIAIGPLNEVYVAGYIDGNDVIKKSTDSGANWSVVDTNSGVQSLSKKMAVDSNGNVFMSGTISSGSQTILRKGTLNGSSWNTVVTFPIEPGHSNFTLLGLSVFDDDSIWIAGRERNASSVFTTVIYRSIDGGLTFTEVFRNLETNWNKMTLKQDGEGDVYAHTLYKVIKNSDGGSTWEDFYDGTVEASRIAGFQFDNLGRLYVLNDDDKVLTQNQFDGTWFLVFDYALYNPIPYAYIEQITDCGNMSQVCLIGHYDISVKGAVNEMIPLVIP